MEATEEKSAVRAASEEVSREFKTLINSDHLQSLNQTQNLMYLSIPISIPLSSSSSSSFHDRGSPFVDDVQTREVTGQQCSPVSLQRLLRELFR